MAKLSLQEQMLKAGLVNEKKLKKAKKSSKKSRVQNREAKAAAEATKLAQQERDKALNQERNNQELAKQIQAQIKQLIETNKIKDSNGEVKYNFTHDSKVKSLYINELSHTQLVKGQLTIAIVGEGYELIPTIVANKIKQRDESHLIEISHEEPEVDEDDPYKDFVVPDDLMW